MPIFIFILFILQATVLAQAQSSAEFKQKNSLPNQENHEFIRERGRSLIRMGDPKYFTVLNPHVRSTDIVAATAFLGCGRAEWKRFMVELPGMPSAEDPVEMFSLPPLVRYLYQYSGCLSDDQKKELLSNFKPAQNLLGHGTTNHAIVKASSWYLLAQYFPDAIWTDRDSKTTFSSLQLMAALKPLLAARTKSIFHFGHYEWLSSNYAVANEYPLLNLIDFAKDPEVRKNATDEAILEIAILRAQSFHGVIVPPFTRKSVDQRNAMEQLKNYAPSFSQQLLWYYFGDPAGFGLYDFRSGLGTFFISMLPISPWLPPDAVLQMNSQRPVTSLAEQSIKSVTYRFSNWGEEAEPEIFGDSLITDDYSIGTGNLYFNPYEYGGHIQTFSILLKSDRPHNEVECYQPFWHSAMGEDAWSTDRSSPFQQMLRYDNSSVIMLFDIPKIDPWQTNQNNRFWADRSDHKDGLLQLVTCRFARDFDEIIREPNWIFVRHGDVYAAMATLKGSNEYDHASGSLTRIYTVVKIREPKTALFFRVEKRSESLSFEQFRMHVKDNLPSYNSENSTAVILGKNGAKTEFKFEIHKAPTGNFWSSLPVIIENGKIFKYQNKYVVQSPDMTLHDGILHVQSAGGELTLAH